MVECHEVMMGCEKWSVFWDFETVLFRVDEFRVSKDHDIVWI